MATVDSDCEMWSSIPPHVIPHQKKHEHALVLADIRDYHAIVCLACGIPIRSGSNYACFRCQIGVHKECPQVSVARKNFRLRGYCLIYTDGQLLSHVCRYRDSETDICERCGEPCRGIFRCRYAYSASHCCSSKPLHEVCAFLPPIIQVPFHHHFLYLIDNERDKYSTPNKNKNKNKTEPSSSDPLPICYACRSGFPSYDDMVNEYRDSYSCVFDDCSDFCLHVSCAQLMPTLKHDGHEHPLTLVSVKPEDIDNDRFRCNWCRRGWCKDSDGVAGKKIGVYRCLSVNCDFSIHQSCSKYPKLLLNEEEHPHDLMYCPPDSVHLDIDLDDYYCDKCGDPITEDQPIYKCNSVCPTDIFFHRDCAFIPSQEKSPLKQGDSLELFHELAEAIPTEDIPEELKDNLPKDIFPDELISNVPFLALLGLDERIAESRGKIENLTLELEMRIQQLYYIESRYVNWKSNQLLCKQEIPELYAKLSVDE